MGSAFLLTVEALVLASAVALTLWGLANVLPRRSAPAMGSVPSVAPVVHLQGVGELPLERGVLLNTLWEHLPQADCQAGECGGCRVRLLDGTVRWIREPVATFDRSTHVLACSCEAQGPLRCRIES